MGDHARNRRRHRRGRTATRPSQHVALVVLGRAAAPGDKTKLMSTGRYEDDLVRTPDGWRFARRRCTLDGWKTQ